MTNQTADTIGSYMERKGYLNSSAQVIATNKSYDLVFPIIIESSLSNLDNPLEIYLGKRTHIAESPLDCLFIPLIGKQVAAKFKVIYDSAREEESYGPELRITTITSKGIDMLVRAVRKFDQIMNSPELKKAERDTILKITRTVELLL